jgi:putative transposase
MVGNDRVIDNIFVERFWRNVKYEHIYLYAYEDGVSLYEGLYRYFELYNHVRMHQSLIYETPASKYLRNDERGSSGMPCGPLAKYSQCLTVIAHAREGESLKKSRPTSENHLKFNELLS